MRPVTGAGRNTRLSLRLRRPGEEEGDLMVREQHGAGDLVSICNQKGRQKGMPTLPSSSPGLPSSAHPTSHACTAFHPQEQTMCLLQRCLPSEMSSSPTLTLRPSRCRGSLAIPVPTLDPLNSLAQVASSLTLNLTPIPDSFASALPSCRGRHCQQLAQAFLSLAKINNKMEAKRL